MSEYYFRTSDLAVGYNGKPLIRDIEIRLRAGEILTLIGPNGSGKSTILKSITKHHFLLPFTFIASTHTRLIFKYPALFSNSFFISFFPIPLTSWI